MPEVTDAVAGRCTTHSTAPFEIAHEFLHGFAALTGVMLEGGAVMD